MKKILLFIVVLTYGGSNLYSQCSTTLELENVTTPVTGTNTYKSSQYIYVNKNYPTNNSVYFNASGTAANLLGTGIMIELNPGFVAEPSGTGSFIAELNPCVPTPVTAAPFAEPELTGASGYTVYPNPVSGILNIRANRESSQVYLKLFSVKGQLTAQQKQTSVKANSVYGFDITGAAPGMYILLIANGKETFRYKIVKE